VHNTQGSGAPSKQTADTRRDPQKRGLVKEFPQFEADIFHQAIANYQLQ
jgi:hypothetical protein